MALSLAVSLVFAPCITSFAAGQMAKKSGRKYWPWFFAGSLLPFVANIIIYYLPYKLKIKETELRPVENEEIFDHLFILPDSN
jgi:hypothetical protein